MVLRRKKGWIGIDLGSRAVKLVQLERVGGKPRIAASAIVRRSHIDRGLTKHGQDTSPQSGFEHLAEDVITALALTPAFSGRRTACVLPMRWTDLHALELPSSSPEECRAMIAHELSSIYDGEKCPREFDFWQTDRRRRGDGPQVANVNVLSAPREVISKVMDNVSRARLRCEVLDGLPFALARAIEMGAPTTPTGPIGAIDWGFTTATFCVVFEGRPMFTRRLRNSGLVRWAEAVSQTLGLSEDDALELLATHGLAAPEGLADPECSSGREREIRETLTEITAGLLNEMAEEVRKTTAYLRVQYGDLYPERLCLLGNGATVKHITGPLSEKVGIPVEIWRMASTKQQPSTADNPPELLATAAALSALAWSS